MSEFRSAKTGSENYAASLILDAGATFHLTNDFSVYALGGAGVLVVKPQDVTSEVEAALAASLKVGVN